jgi:hypothetical protein
MINYRAHRGSLEDSLATAQSFESLQAFDKYIRAEIRNNYLISSAPFSYEITYYGEDERCNQVLWMVRVIDVETNFPIGFIYEERHIK